MQRWPLSLAIAVAAALLLGLAITAFLFLRPTPETASELEELPHARTALAEAQRSAAAAAAEARRLEAEAARTGAAEETARRSLASLAAQLQEAEARENLLSTRLRLLEQERRANLRQLSTEREPLARLTGSLQQLALRPAALSALQPGSAREALYLRAVLSHAAPAIAEQTAELRGQLTRGRQLAAEQREERLALQQHQAGMTNKRSQLQAAVARYRQQYAQASEAARQEGRRAAELALRSRDLGELVDEFDRVASLRAELAALPGPVLRPGTVQGRSSPPSQSNAARAPASPATPPTEGLRLPVLGQLVGGFGDTDGSDLRRTGVTLRPRAAALVVAPREARVAFAGPYPGHGHVVILEHQGGWTSLLAGLAQVDVTVGQEVASGAPLGSAAERRPEITFELRRDGQPINPLPLLLNPGR